MPLLFVRTPSAQTVNIDRLRDRNDRGLAKEAEPKIVIFGPLHSAIAPYACDHGMPSEYCTMGEDVASEKARSERFKANRWHLYATVVSLRVDDNCCTEARRRIGIGLKRVDLRT
jgi:hypothetical protein